VKNSLVIGLIVGIGVLVIAGFYFLNSESEEDINNNESEIFCQNYDDNREECLLQEECKWVSGKNICNPLGSMDEGDENDSELNQELEDMTIPNNPSNTLCKKIPLSGQSPYTNNYGERYLCLAIVNHDARFCEGIIDEENEKKMCLAHANKDSSYCKEVEGQDAKKVCYYMLAVSSENASVCSDINYSQHEKEQCYFNFMSNLYQWDKSDEIKTEYCVQLGSPDDNTCLALKARDISMCGDNPNCLTFFEQPLSFCDERPDFSSCIKDRAKTSKNISICELIPQPDRDICVGVYCTHTELDVNICDTIEDIGERQNRYLELAMDLANW